LKPIGHSDTKKVIFEFIPDEQHQNFYDSISFFNFSSQVLSYFEKQENEKYTKPFILIEDIKMIILVRDENVSNILDRMIKLFTVRESFEICAKLSTIKNGWTEFITNFKEEDNKEPVIEKKKRTYKKKNNSDNVL